MLDRSLYHKKWLPLLAIVTQSPEADITLQYRNLVIKRSIADNISAFLLQYISFMISTLLPPPTPLWFGSGVACAMVFLRGYRVLPGTWLGVSAAFYVATHSILLSLICPTFFILQTILLKYITQQYINPTLVFYSKSTFTKFVLCCSIITGIVSYCLILTMDKSYIYWPQWWLANLDAILIIGIGWVATDTFSTYSGISFNLNVNRYKIIRWAFVIILFLEMLIYLNIVEISLLLMLFLQMLLTLGIYIHFRNSFIRE